MNLVAKEFVRRVTFRWRADPQRAGRRRARAVRGADHQSVKQRGAAIERAITMPMSGRRRMQALRAAWLAGVLAWASDILDRLGGAAAELPGERQTRST
jgi:hypothetical protein